MRDMFATLTKAFRHVTFDRSYERYYSADGWNQDWAKGYDLTVPKEDARYGTMLTMMRRYERGGPILDVGCGDGLLAERYRSLSQARIVGFDYSETAVEHAIARNIANTLFFHADSRTHKPAEHFPLIVLNESLYYLQNYMGVLDNLSRGLAPDGVFLISMYDTIITRRIWKNVLGAYLSLQGAFVKDEQTGRRWWIRSLRPRLAC
jgi:predicted TPR repeat methyltransferase